MHLSCLSQKPYGSNSNQSSDSPGGIAYLFTVEVVSLSGRRFFDTCTVTDRTNVSQNNNPLLAHFKSATRELAASMCKTVY
jgi:hypothetical protein